MARGVTVWFTGLSSAGKTTVAIEVEKLLNRRGRAVERLDGDIVRRSLSRDLGFTKEDRDKNIERVTFVSKLLTRTGAVVLASFISPYRAARAAARDEIGTFLEVHVTAEKEVLYDRDVKGLYAKALAGEIKDFTGVDAPYEAPQHPDLVLHTDRESIAESAAKVVALLEAGGFLDPAAGSGEAYHVQTTPTVSGDAPDVRWSRVPGPIAPHGGVLVDRELVGEPAREAAERARSLPQVPLDPTRQADLLMIATGAASPLVGFLGQLDYECVVDAARLSDGTVWPLPLVLPVDAELADRLTEGQELALVDESGEPLGVLRLTERYRYDKQREAERVYGTTDAAHPGVARLYGQGDVLLAGPVHLFRRPRLSSIAPLDPLQTRQAFDERGWQQVVAFQTRNPLHRAHEYLLRTALEIVDGLLVHPLVGQTKADDLSAEVRMQAYNAVLDNYFPADRVLLSAYPAAMRYAGPREALWHALTRKNYGVTHFIVGRDHAGVGSYYGTYDAQRFFDQFRPDELGITPLKFEHAFWDRSIDGMATGKTSPGTKDQRVFLSGTEVRRRLKAGEDLPVEFTRPEVAEILRAHAAQPVG